LALRADREAVVELGLEVGRGALTSDTWEAGIKRTRRKQLPLTASGLQGLRDEYARALVGETLKLERAPNAECRVRFPAAATAWPLPILPQMLQTALPRMPISPSAT
jgi:hypothetical protein